MTEPLLYDQRSVRFAVIDAETNAFIRGGTCQWRELANQSFAPNEIVLENIEVQHGVSSIDMRVDEHGASYQPVYAVPLVTAHHVKLEASRRILNVMPEHQQRNSLAQGIEAVMAYGPDPAGWPAELVQAQAEAMAKWAQIKQLRLCSNEIEAMEPIPPDYTDDRHWP